MLLVDMGDDREEENAEQWTERSIGTCKNEREPGSSVIYIIKDILDK